MGMSWFDWFGGSILRGLRRFRRLLLRLMRGLKIGSDHCSRGSICICPSRSRRVELVASVGGLLSLLADSFSFFLFFFSRAAESARKEVGACAGSSPRAFPGVARGWLGPNPSAPLFALSIRSEAPPNPGNAHVADPSWRRHSRILLLLFFAASIERDLASLRSVQAVTHASRGFERGVIKAGSFDARRGAGMRFLRPSPSKAPRCGRRRGRWRFSWTRSEKRAPQSPGG